MTKRLALLACAMLFAAVGLYAAGKTEGAASTMTRISAVWGVQHPGDTLVEDNLLERILRDRFQIEVDWMGQIPHAEANTKFTLMFATDDYPDTIFNSNQPALYRRLGIEGYLQEVTQFFPKIPNYRALYSDEEWERTVVFQRASDGNMYWLPQYRPYVATNAWLYRKDSFDELGVAPPRTPEEMFSALMAIKQHDPSAIPIPNKWGAGWLEQGFNQLYGVQNGMYLDPFNGELVEFGATTDRNREKLIFMHRLYRNDLIDKEYISATDTQFDDRFRQDRAYFLFGFVGWFDRFTALNRESNPDAEWTYMVGLPTALEGGNTAYIPNVTGQAWGLNVADTLTGDRLDRYLEFIDWLCTDEGIRFQGFGIEGETYTMVNGQPKYLPIISGFTDPTQKRPGALGIYSYTIWSREAIIEFYNTDAPFVYGQALASTPGYEPLWSYPLLMTAEERSRLADLSTVVNDTVAAYTSRFVMGELDPSNNAHWNLYLEDLRRANVEEWVRLSRSIFARTYN